MRDYRVDSTADQVFEAVGGGSDRVIASVRYALAAGQEIERLTTNNSAGTTAINLTGNAFADTIEGNAGANTLDGGAGDTLIGFGGADIFSFSTPLVAGNVDTIVDFNVADDTIRLSHSVFSALPTGVLADTAFHIGPAAADASDRIIYNSTTGALFYDSDGTGTAAAVQFAIVSQSLTLTRNDFAVV